MHAQFHEYCILIKIYTDFRVSQLTGFEPQDLIEKTLYQYIHASDILAMRYAHQICKCHAPVCLITQL